VSFVVVQIVQAKVGATASSVAVSAFVTKGNVLVAYANGDSVVSIAFSDSLNGSWGANLDSFSNPHEGSSNYIHATGRLAGTTLGGALRLTATYGASTGAGSVTLMEFANVGATDGHTGQAQLSFDGTPTDAVTSGTVSPTKFPSVVIAPAACNQATEGGGTVSRVAGTGFTQQFDGTDNLGTRVETKRTLAAGAVGGTWTASGTGANNNDYDSFVIVLNEIPTITVQPATQRVREGLTATFNITATAAAGSLHYQWKQNGSNVGTDSSSYTTPANTIANNLDAYTCVVTDDNGSATSQTAYLLVYEVPGIAWVRA
jgi:hypothetical protein